jgi:hypothetical protein
MFSAIHVLTEIDVTLSRVTMLHVLMRLVCDKLLTAVHVGYNNVPRVVLPGIIRWHDILYAIHYTRYTIHTMHNNCIHYTPYATRDTQYNIRYIHDA